MPSSLKVCFAASEASPFAKTGGLADVAAALPAQLQRRGHDARLFVPLHAQVDRGDLETHVVDFIRDIEIQLGSATHRFTALTTRMPGTEADVYLIDCPEMFQRSGVYTSDADEAERYTLFSRAVIECCQRMAWAPDVFHCNDWHTALIPLLLRTVYEWDTLFERSKTLVTIHNLGYQGVFPGDKISALGLEQWTYLLDQEDLHDGKLNFLRTGLIYADVVSTVSPTYAEEIQTAEFGMGLQDLLRARKGTLVGILNGVDYDEWSPERDSFIPHKYSATDLEGKAGNKSYLLDKLSLAPTPDAPLVGIVSRLVHHKGLDLCFTVLPELLAQRDMRLVVLGTGEERYESFFEELQQSFPGKACFHRGYHNEMAHVIEAASDMILMPSRYEPCGLNQLFGLRYGTIPIVRKTGGLADSVEQVNGAGEGTGFVFEHFTGPGLRWAVSQALDLYQDRPAWRKLVLNAMGRDFSWKVQAERYVELYNWLTQA